LILAMIEQGCVDPTCLLDDPVGVASAISRDLRLTQSFPTTVRGRSLTALEIQQVLADRAGEFVASGAARGIVPEAEAIIAQWNEILDLLRRRALEALAERCDNWLKYVLLDRYRAGHGLAWRSAECQMLDLMFGSLDPDEGLFFQMVRAGVVKDMPTDHQIAAAMRQPPEDTRAYLRAHVLRKYGHLASTIDWSHINFRVAGSRSWWSMARLPMPDPRRWGKAEADPMLANCETLEDLVDAVVQLTEAEEFTGPNGRSAPASREPAPIGELTSPQDGQA
jgi:proteasome accessory factor A